MSGMRWKIKQYYLLFCSHGYCEKNAHPSIYSNIASGLTAGDRGNGYETINYYVENV